MLADGGEIVRPSTRGDVVELNRLFAEVFGHERDSAVWGWKYFDNPRGSHGYVVEAEGRLVAHCGGTPILMRDGSRQYLALQSVDFMSTRRYAGGVGKGGVFPRMVNAFFQAYCREGRAEMVYGFPGERHRILGEKILGYAPIEPVGELTLSGDDREAVRFEPLEPRNLALLSQTASPLEGVRDEVYLDWRYRSHPTHRYEAMTVRRWPFGKASAAAVIRRDGDDLRVMELLGDVSVRNLRVMAEVLRRGARSVVAWAPLAHAVRRALQAAGFTAAERPHLVEARFFNGRAVPSSGELYYSLGDYDVY